MNAKPMYDDDTEAEKNSSRAFWLMLAFCAILAFAGLAIIGNGDAQAATQSVNFKEEIEVGGQVITTTTDAQFLTVPARARHAWVVVKAQPACWGFGATAPTPTSGGEWPAGFVGKFDNDRLALAKIRVISCAEGASTVKVLYTGDRRSGDS